MLKFLRSLFSSKPKEPRYIEVSVDVTELGKWLDTHMEKSFEKILKDITELDERIKAQSADVKEKLELLGKAELVNKNMPPKVLQIMAGNRQSYIKKTGDFLDSIRISKGSSSKLQESVASYNTALAELKAGTGRSYQVMNEFFADELKQIIIGMKDIQQSMAEIRELISKAGLDSLEQARKKAESIAGQISALQEISEKMHRLLEEKIDTAQQEKKFQKRLDELKQSPDYRAYEMLAQDKQSVATKMKDVQDRLTTEFAQIEPALRKYERMSMHHKIIGSYLDNPAQALVQDPGLEIIDILDRLKKALSDGSIDMKDKKRDKIISAIDSLDKERLKAFSAQYAQLLRTKGTISEKLKMSRVTNVYEDILYRLSHVSHKKAMLETEISTLIRSKEKIDISRLKEDIISDLKEHAAISLTIEDKSHILDAVVLAGSDEEKHQASGKDTDEDKSTDDNNTVGSPKPQLSD